MLCKICESATEPFGEQQILQTFTARYLRCTHCGFVFVEQPTWLEQAYEHREMVSFDGGRPPPSEVTVIV